jgi:hypothetical protein
MGDRLLFFVDNVAQSLTIGAYRAPAYNFRDDDIHWRPVGVRRAAQAIGKVWKNFPSR